MTEEKVGRIFIGGLSCNTTKRTLERTFGQYGKVIEAQVQQRLWPAVMLVI
jgi:heterogeneous nuclear ribonucleoprotein G